VRDLAVLCRRFLDAVERHDAETIATSSGRAA
jgi:hypothetical protein